MEKKCCVEWCNNKVRSNTCEYCDKHYSQIWKHGKVFRTMYDDNEIIINNEVAFIICRDKKGDINYKIIVDAEDVELLKEYKWSCSKGDYCYGHKKNSEEKVAIHRLLMNPKDNEEVDHINNNPLDNRKCNLRLCDRSNNCCNKQKQSNNKSGYKNICWKNKQQKWQVSIVKNGKDYRKFFNNIDEAIKWRNEILEQVHKDFAKKD